jgi:hypothetical protein
MPDPLLGFSLQSFVPPVQPYAVSGAVALLSLDHPSLLSETPGTVASAEAPRQLLGAPYGEGFLMTPAFRALLHTRVRHCTAGGLGRRRARGSPGLSPLQGVLPHRNAATFTAAPLMRLLQPGDESTFGALFRVLLPGSVGLSLARLPTLLGFPAF